MSNRLTARALFELMVREDFSSPDLDSRLFEFLRELPDDSPTCLLGFDTGGHGGSEEASDREVEVADAPRAIVYLRLVFRDEQAAYYQFPLFPDLDGSGIWGASRKRAGAVQHLRLELADPEAVQGILESCRENPHLLRVETSSELEFQQAPSHGI